MYPKREVRFNEINDDYEFRSHIHCWHQNQPSACGIPLEEHKQCCLCGLRMEDIDSTPLAKIQMVYNMMEHHPLIGPNRLAEAWNGLAYAEPTGFTRRRLQKPMYKQFVVKEAAYWRTFLNELKFPVRYVFRSFYNLAIGWPILTREIAEVLVKFLGTKRVVDVGAGTAWLSKYFFNRGIDITPYDVYEDDKYQYQANKLAFMDINKARVNGDYPEADVIILSWPCYSSSFAETVLRSMRKGQYVIYQGEGPYGCTANDDFHNLLGDENEFKEIDLPIAGLHVRFDGIHDDWYVYQKV